MAVKEVQKEKRDPRTIIFVAVLILGFLALGGVIYWLIKPAAPRTVKLTDAQTKEQAKTFDAPSPAMPAAPPLPQATDPGPTLVSLDLKQATTRQALAELVKQAKGSTNPVPSSPGGILAALTTPRGDVTINNQPFWAAMVDLCKKGQLYPYSDWQSPNQIQFQQGNADFANGPVKMVGSCMLVLSSVVSDFHADLVRPTSTAGRDLRVDMQLYVEPKLAPYRISAVATIETAVDEKGTSLIRRRDPWDDRNGGNERSTWQRNVTARLTFPDNAGNKIATLKGYASVALAGPPQSKNIDNPLTAKNADTTIDGVTVQLIQLRKQGGNTYEARMAGDVNNPIFKEYERFSKIATLVDQNGKEFQQSGGYWGGGRANTMEFGMNFTGPSAASEPKTMRITLPTQMKELRVPFEFTDLPLPH